MKLNFSISEKDSNLVISAILKLLLCIIFLPILMISLLLKVCSHFIQNKPEGAGDDENIEYQCNASQLQPLVNDKYIAINNASKKLCNLIKEIIR